MQLGKYRICSHQEVVEFQFTRIFRIEMIIRLAYNKETSHAVALILAAQSVVSSTDYGVRDIER